MIIKSRIRNAIINVSGTHNLLSRFSPFRCSFIFFFQPGIRRTNRYQSHGRGRLRRRRGVVKAVVRRTRNSYSFNPRYLQTASSPAHALIRRPLGYHRGPACRVYLHPLKTLTYPLMMTTTSNWQLPPPPPPRPPLPLPIYKYNLQNNTKACPRQLSTFDIAKMDPINRQL